MKNKNGNIITVDPELMIRIMEWNLENQPHSAIMMVGRPGIGKTEMAKQVIEKTGALGIIAHPAVHDQTNYGGLPWMVDEVMENGQTRKVAEFLPIGFLRMLLEADRPTIVVLDDFGQALPGTQAASAQLFLERKLDDKPISPHVSFIVCTNRREDRSGVSGIYEMIKSRMLGGIYHVEPSVDAWSKWAIKDKQPTWMIALCRFKSDFLLDWEPSPDLVNSPCPRTVAACGNAVKNGLPQDLWHTMFSGIAGQGFATEAVAFYKLYAKLPNPDSIIMNPNKAEIPTDPAVQFAICGSLAARSTEQNFQAILDYFERWLEPDNFQDGLPRREFVLAYFKDAITRNPKLVKTHTYTNWSAQHAELYVG